MGKLFQNGFESSGRRFYLRHIERSSAARSVFGETDEAWIKAGFDLGRFP
jgi:hypothetical protein